jgi:PAS domain S-box-containing protein
MRSLGSETIKSGSAKRDLLICLGVLTGLFIIAGYMDLAERWHAFAESHEHWELDEVLIALAMSCGGFAWYSCRRWIESRSEVEKYNEINLKLIEENAIRHKVEKALRESEERYELALAGTNDGLWDRNIATGDCYLSPRWLEIFGYREDELPQHVDTFVKLIHPDDRDRIQGVVQSHFEDGALYDAEVRMRHKDNSIVWVRVRGRALRDGAGNPMRMAGSISDITKLKRAEFELRESEETLSAIIDNSPSIISLRDTEGRILKINKAYEKFYNVTENEARGTLGHEWLGDKLAQQLITAAREVLSTRMPVETEYETLDTSGKARYKQAVIFPVLDAEGVVVATGGITTDITEHQERENQLRQAQKMEAVGQLTGGLAHDFNNLLAVTLGNAEILSEQLGDGKGGNMANTIIRAARRGGELTHRLLSFSRQQTLSSELVDVNSLIAGMADMLNRTLGETIEIVTKDADDPCCAKADPGQLEIALLNLAVNSKDAMPEGGSLILESANVQLGDEDIADDLDVMPGDYVMLSVTDTGTGMTPEVLEHVYEPFFTTKGVGEGSGLGLSMVHGFAAQSDGFVHIESQVGKGTSIRIYLPRATGPAANPETCKEKVTQVPSVSGTILVVEDDPDVREIVVEILSGLGRTIIEAEDGKSALLRMDERQDIDVLFTDVVLPGGMSGPDIAGEARDKTPSLKVVFTSGYPDGEIDELASGDEKRWFIRKPYSRSELVELFNGVLQS